MATLTADSPKTPAKSGVNRWDSPWLNGKLIAGLIIISSIAMMGVFGELFWDLRLARVGTSPQDLPPAFMPGGTWDHPLGTESSGRDMLAVLLVGAPRSLRIGLIAATIGVVVGMMLGFLPATSAAGSTPSSCSLSDAWITIPRLAVLIVISAYVRQISAETMALLLALFAWPAPTRLIRAQVLTLRERGYVHMARLSGANTFDVIFREMMPNMLPYLAASYTGNCLRRHPGCYRPGSARPRPHPHPHAGHDDLLRQPGLGHPPRHVVVVGLPHCFPGANLFGLVPDHHRPG